MTELDPTNLEDIEYVIINQPGDAPRIMNFEDNFGQILAMAGFTPSAEFYAPDPNPDLVGTPFENVLIRQQVLGTYETPDPVPFTAPVITSTAVTGGAIGAAYWVWNEELRNPRSFVMDHAYWGPEYDAGAVDNGYFVAAVTDAFGLDAPNSKSKAALGQLLFAHGRNLFMLQQHFLPL